MDRVCKRHGLTLRAGHGHECRECRHEWRRPLRLAKRKALTDFKMVHGCSRCGYRVHHEALQFHHRDPTEKKAKPSELINVSWDRLWAEVAKCDVVCANCHAIIHAEEREAE